MENLRNTIRIASIKHLLTLDESVQGIDEIESIHEKTGFRYAVLSSYMNDAECLHAYDIIEFYINIYEKFTIVKSQTPNFKRIYFHN